MSLSSLGHEFIFHDGQSPDCIHDGWHDYRACSRCEFNDFLTIPALGHDYGEWEISKQSSCFEHGEERRVCTRCENHFETRYLQTVAHTEGDWITDKVPSCESGCLKIKYCTVCNEVLATEEIPALGHDFGEWVQTSAPNCTDKGTEIRVCSRNKLHTESREISALGHSYEWNGCADGHIATCTECGDVIGLSPHEWNNGVCDVCGFEKPVEKQLSFEKIGDSYTVTGLGTVTASEIKIPSEYNGLAVTAIAPYAFEGSAVTEIIIPDSVTCIGKGAFRFCGNLTRVVLSDNLLDIGEEAFYSCTQWENITVPQSVKVIGANAFYGCNFTHIEFENKAGWKLYKDGNFYGTVSEEDLQNSANAIWYLNYFSECTWKTE